LIEAGPLEERRRPYRLSAAGKLELERHLDGLQRLTATARTRLAER
jgi:hypothetical protein